MFPDRWPAFVGVLLVVLLVPGPDFVVMFRHALAGARAGMWAAAGNVTGLAVHTFLAATGVAALIAARPALLDAVRLGGAAYLASLGLAALYACLPRRASLRRRRPDQPSDDGSTGDHRDGDAAHPFRDGVATNILNPKAVLFFVGVMPLFVSAGSDVTGQTLVLAMTTILLAGLWWTLVVWVAGRGGRLLSGARARRAMDGVTAAAFLGLAVFVMTA